MKVVPYMLVFLFSAALAQPTPKVCFSPEGRCDQFVRAEVLKAKREIVVAAYWLTNKVIADALSSKHKTGKVNVKIIVDDSCANSKWCKLPGKTVVDFPNRVMHHKFMVIDKRVLIVGSMNFTMSGAKKNNENVMVLYNRFLVKAFYTEFMKLWKIVNSKGFTSN